MDPPYVNPCYPILSFTKYFIPKKYQIYCDNSTQNSTGPLMELLRGQDLWKFPMLMETEDRTFSWKVFGTKK